MVSIFIFFRPFGTLFIFRGARRTMWPGCWRPLLTNLYPSAISPSREDVQVCCCIPDPTTGFGCVIDDCINCATNTECDTSSCPCGEGCMNQRFSQRIYHKFEVRRTEHKGLLSLLRSVLFYCSEFFRPSLRLSFLGLGFFADEDIDAGDFVIEYVGEFIEDAELVVRKQRYESLKRECLYFMKVPRGSIDAMVYGNPARFINHSCDPNCETHKWLVKGLTCIGIFAKKNIKSGQEISFDYNYDIGTCHCMTRKCRYPAT